MENFESPAASGVRITVLTSDLTELLPPSSAGLTSAIPA
jgi:hypothetical protein